MNLLSYQIALSRRDELLRQTADYTRTHQPAPRPAAATKPSRGALPKLRRGLLPKSA